MDSHIDETRHVIASGKFENDKRYKETKIGEVITAICAMLNSNGGKVVIDFETNNNNIPAENTPFSQISLLIRMLEQTMTSMIGLRKTIFNIDFQEDEKGEIIFVKKSDSLITSNYNLCLPSQTQIVHVSPGEPLQNVVDDIINRKVVAEPVQIGSHCKIFCKDTNCRIRESKMVQLKNLEAHATKRTTLADRVISKGNKLTCYVSGFSNLNGGHIYYGINDNRIVVGELIASEEERSEITKKVEKAIKRMIWPEHVGQPKRGEHWNIFFVPVLDKNSKPIPTTFVIVIYIAPCLGGVFTDEPECYEMAQGKVAKMSFITWKKRVLPQSMELCYVDNSPSRSKRVTWSSTRIRNFCVFADHLLTQCVNNGQSMETISSNLQQTFPDHKVELRLLVLSKRVMVSYRSNCFNMAKNLLDEYSSLLTATNEFEFFDAIRVYLQTAMLRAKGDLKALSAILPGAMEKAEKIAHGHITAAIYLVCATVLGLLFAKDSKEIQGYCPSVLPIHALEHLQYTQDSPILRKDMEQKAHMTKALLCLGCDISGKLTSKVIDNKSLNEASSSLTVVEKLINDGNKLNVYRETGFNIVKSILAYRCSQVQPDSKSLLREAFDLCKGAECLASEYKFAEMLNWARASKALCTEGLVRTHFKKPL